MPSYPNLNVGPVVFTTQGDQFIEPATIASILWNGATVAGDRIEVVEGRIINGALIGSGNLLWPCSTDGQYTYLGITFGERGLSAPNGFRLKICTPTVAGRICVYLKES